jgi:hypothetical protein
VYALARLVNLGGEALEADGGIDQVAQNRLALGGVTREVGVDRLREECLPKAGVAPRARGASFILISCVRHVLPRYLELFALRRLAPCIEVLKNPYGRHGYGNIKVTIWKNVSENVALSALGVVQPIQRVESRLGSSRKE